MPPEATASANTEPRFSFLRLLVHRAVFEQIERPATADGETKPQRLPVDLQVAAKIRLDVEANQAAVTLTVTLIPDVEWQPYKVEYVLSGIFAAEGASSDQLVEFCKLGAPPILFPYIREGVHRMTMDGVGGPIKLDPINIAEMVNRTPWATEDAPQEVLGGE